ncbi:MAG TPA: hypothetical protein VFK06_08735 [Candidatus Angelobacter sp.]|nr:hypothetical protein [Candidatus Angelobacter sp.]
MYEDLNAIARLRFSKETDAIALQTQENIREAANRYAATAGLNIRSGQHEASLARLRIVGLERMADSLYQIWVDLIKQRNGHIGRQDIPFIANKVNEFINAQKGHLHSTFAQHGGAMSSVLAQESEQRIYAMSARIRRDLEIMVREYDAFPKKSLQTATNTTIHIENSSIANLNLGSQIGTITASLNQVVEGDQSQKEFAQALQEFTQAVIRASLSDADKKEVVETLSLLATEATRKPEERSKGILKAAVAWIPSVVSTATQLVTLWDKVTPIIRAYFNI